MAFYNPETTWIGYAIKSGGQILFGHESYWGECFRLSSLSNPMPDSFTFNCKNWILGLGLGGGIGMHLVIVVNARSPTMIMGRPIGDGWSTDISVPAMKATIGISSVFNIDRMGRVLQIVKTISNYNSLMDLKSVSEFAAQMCGELPSRPDIYAFGIPGASYARRVSIRSKSFGGEVDIKHQEGINKHGNSWSIDF